MIKLFECYAGYGGASFALKKSNIPYKIVGYSEIKTSAIKLYECNHKNIDNYGDITKINPKELPDMDLITGGFPCQDVSLAGLRDLSKGRTKTVFKMLDIIKEKKPKYVLLENVKGILSMLEGELLREIVRQLKGMGYTVSYKLLNSCEHGIPQNRERVWICGELGATAFGFNPFPNKEELKIHVSDLLEDNVDEKYYLTQKQIDYYTGREEIRGQALINNVNRDVGVTLCARKPQRGITDMNLIMHSKQPRTSKTGKGSTGPLKRDDNISYTVDTGNSQFIIKEGRIRVLTERECFRLMGFVNDEIKFGTVSSTGLYQAAGNGWEINIVSKIFTKWLK